MVSAEGLDSRVPKIGFRAHGVGFRVLTPPNPEGPTQVYLSVLALIWSFP